MHITSAFGHHRSGYLHGEDRRWAEQIVADGGIVACQGPSQANSPTNNVTLLERDGPTGGWFVYDVVELHDEPEDDTAVSADLVNDPALGGIFQIINNRLATETAALNRKADDVNSKAIEIAKE